MRATLAAALVCLASSAEGATVDIRCPGMPRPTEEDLWARASRLLADAGMPWATLGVECDPTGAWLVWVDGSRAPIAQTRGIVQGALDLLQYRLAADRYAATHPPGVYAPPDAAPPGYESPTAVAPDDAAMSLSRGVAAPGDKSADKHGTEGDLGLTTAAQFWSGGSLGSGPRLDRGVGPPGKLA